MFLDFRIRLFGLVKGLFKADFALRRYLARGGGRVVALVPIMNNLQDASLFDLAIDGPAPKALLRLPTLCLHFLADLCSSKVIDMWAAEVFKECPSVMLR